MKMNKFIIVLLLLSLSCILMADPTRDPLLVSLDNEFLDSEVTFAPIAAWESAGSNAMINPLTVIEIDISNIEPIVSQVPSSSIIDTTSFVSAIPNDEMDDSAVFTALIDFVRDRQLNETGHVRILIPPGVYNFSDQIVMHSNISLKGAGSDLTELRFLIQSDPTSGTMTLGDCRKDAIQVNGSGKLPHQRIHSVGIEDIKIVRTREGLSAREVKSFVGDHCTMNGIISYWGNNIAIRYGSDCWVTGVESENTFRNHVTLDYSINTTVSGVYFHDANDYGGDGYGYGVGIWDSSNNRVENSIFKHLRHGVTIVDGSWFNVIGYNYFREQYSYAELPPIPNFIIPFPDEIVQKWSDIAIHGESYNTWQSEDDPSVAIDSLRTPYYNLIEGNNLEYLCVDATHQHNGTHNTFINNRVTEQIHVMGYDGFPDWLTGFLVFESIAIPSLVAIFGGIAGSPGWGPGVAAGAMTGWDLGLWVAYYYSEIFLKFCCKDCAALRMADQFTYAIPWIDDTFKFKNQPKQIFINNYAKECNWWKSVIQDYPVRMHSEIASSKNNTRKHYATWWGGTQIKTIHRNAAFDDLQSCYIFDSRPAYWPIMVSWPYNYKSDQNPAQQRWHLNGKKTVGEDDNTTYLVEHTISADTNRQFTCSAAVRLQPQTFMSD